MTGGFCSCIQTDHVQTRKPDENGLLRFIIRFYLEGSHQLLGMRLFRFPSPISSFSSVRATPRACRIPFPSEHPRTRTAWEWRPGIGSCKSWFAVSNPVAVRCSPADIFTHHLARMCYCEVDCNQENRRNVPFQPREKSATIGNNLCDARISMIVCLIFPVGHSAIVQATDATDRNRGFSLRLPWLISFYVS